ncbi:MAG: EF-hand domain-containing protein [Verrucomicrobia bacterium]|nr:EF-hand domain-containing protein [Verrucomicrobiota bacterium]
MKPPSLAPACLAATLFVLTGRADTPAAGLSANDQEILKRYDKNGDGKLDENEVTAAMDENRQAADALRGKARERLKERQQAWVKEFDKNGDGKLDAAERAAMEQAVRARLEKNPHQLKRFDTDGDGKLNDAEWAAAREKLFAGMEKP